MLKSVMHRTARILAPAMAAAFMTLRALAGGPVDVSRLAPERSFLVVNIPNFAQLNTGFEKSELGALWKEPGVKSFVEHITEEQSKALTEFMKKINAESKDLKPPTGGVGLALFMPEGDSKPQKKPAGGAPAKEPPAGMLVVADLGENADSWQELIDKVLDRAQKDKQVTTEEDKYGDAKLTIIKPIKQEAAKKAKKEGDEGDDEEDGADQGPAGLGGILGGPFDNDRELFLARLGSTMAICSDRKALESALDTLGGKEQPAAADLPDFRDTLAQHPGNELAYAVLRAEPLMKFLGEQADEQMDFGPAQVTAIMGVLGIADIKTVSFGLHLGGDEGVMDLSMGVLAPQKKGLLALISKSGGAFEPPEFVPADTSSVARFSFKFGGVLDLLREVAGTLPEQQRGQALAQLDQVVNIAKPALDALGPSVWVVNSLKQPLAADSQMTVVAIEVRDQVTVSNTISSLASLAGGLFEPRDFEGNTIYSAKNGESPVQISLGLGFGRVFVGSTAGVENAMRLAGAKDATRLATDPTFKDAVHALGNDGVAYSFSDIAQDIRWTYWQAQNEDKIFEQSLDAAQLEPDAKAEIMKGYQKHKKKWPDLLPPMDTLLSHLGDTVTEIRSTADGFRGRILLLRPAEKK